MAHPPKLLLEGRPGVGKTTLARKVVERLREEREVAGFTTEEIREGGRRVGFRVETTGGDRAVLAHVDLPGPPRVSRYGVDLESFERTALPALRTRPGTVLVIDELGKMELASRPFRERVLELLEGPVPVLATVHAARHPFTDALKESPGMEVVRITEGNRDRLAEQIAARLLRA